MKRQGRGGSDFYVSRRITYMAGDAKPVVFKGYRVGNFFENLNKIRNTRDSELYVFE